MDDTFLLLLTGLFSQFSASLPAIVVSILAVIGSLHLVMPILQTLVKTIVAITPSKSDDVKYEEVVRSKGFLLFIKVVAWVSGLKLPEKKKVK